MDLQDHTIAGLEEAIKEKDAIIQECQMNTETCMADCDTLEAENDELKSSHEKLESDLSKSMHRVSVLEEKLNSYRQRLSNAVNEHQHLYARCKEKCKETIAQLEEEKQDLKESLDKELAASNSSKVALQMKVATVVEDARKKTQERKPRPLFILNDPADKI